MSEEHLFVKITQKALIQIAGKLLLVREGETWELPGGRVDKGDMDLTHALKRELLEELSIEVIPKHIFTSYLFTKPSGEVALALIYECELANSLDVITKRTGEIDEWKLFTKEELKQLNNIFPNSTHAIKEFLTDQRAT